MSWRGLTRGVWEIGAQCPILGHSEVHEALLRVNFGSSIAVSGMTGNGAELPYLARSLSTASTPFPSLTERPGGVVQRPQSNTMGPPFDNTESRLGRRELHVESNDRLGKALESECANLFGSDATV